MLAISQNYRAGRVERNENGFYRIHDETYDVLRRTSAEEGWVETLMSKKENNQFQRKRSKLDLELPEQLTFLEASEMRIRSKGLSFDCPNINHDPLAEVADRVMDETKAMMRR